MLSGALGCGISGSGPSIFTFSENEKIAKNVADKIAEVYKKNGIPFHVYISKINTNGIKIIHKK